MADSTRWICPLCGNDRVVHVVDFHEGRQTRRRSFCAGPLGCLMSFEADGSQPLPGEGPVSRPRPMLAS